VTKRLGHTGPENMDLVANNVYAIDCDDFNNSYDTPTGHSYFLGDGDGNPGKVFQHMLHAMKTGRVKVDEGTHATILRKD
jgi:hypothetical protein